MVFIVGFRNDSVGPQNHGAYFSEEIEVPEMWFDDPICWVEHLRPRDGIRIVLCVQKDECRALLDVINNNHEF